MTSTTDVAGPTDVAVPPVRARQRAHRILHEPRLVALLLAGGVMATIVVLVIGFSSAFFTASSSDPGSSAQAGQIRLSLSNTGELIDGTALKPGLTRSGTVTITNNELEARMTLGVSNLVNSPSSGPSLADVLNVTVIQTNPGNFRRWTGKLRTLTVTTVSLGTFAKGEQRSFQIDVTWPATEDSPTYASVKTTFVFDWTAESVAQ